MHGIVYGVAGRVVGCDYFDFRQLSPRAGLRRPGRIREGEPRIEIAGYGGSNHSAWQSLRGRYEGLRGEGITICPGHCWTSPEGNRAAASTSSVPSCSGRAASTMTAPKRR